MKSFTAAEVAKHNTAEDCWIIINGKVFDVTKFLNDHPGGKKVIVGKAGQDASQQFASFHDVEKTLAKYGPQLQIGVVGTAQASPAAVVAKSPKGSTGVDLFGELIPYGDPLWYQGWHSPYYNESHRKLRAAVRKFAETEVFPYCKEWDDAKKIPREVIKKCFEAGILPGTIGAPWPTQYAGTNVAGGIRPEEFDQFHELILIDELARGGSAGALWGLFGGLSIGLPPVLHFGSAYLKELVCRPCLTGDKVIALAITEPYAGSDVANLRCEARKTPDGKFYIVNGEKKWITNGTFADFFTTAVRTGGPGMGGVSLLLIPRGPGVTTRQMDCQGVLASGTSFITFENVKVPVENLIGQENQGFKCIMYNFNHERWGSAVQAIRMARVCFEEAMRYSMKRETFGKKLIDHPVIRFKLAHMARQVESTSAWLETITYQMTKMSHDEASQRLGGAIALLKAQGSLVMEQCAREAAQVFGGLAYTKGGQGEKVERLYREVRAFAIPAGSEEIMLDLGIRQAMRPKL